MSVSCGTPRVNFFSNPDVIHLNKPTGTVTENNARAIEDNMVRGKPIVLEPTSSVRSYCRLEICSENGTRAVVVARRRVVLIGKGAQERIIDTFINWYLHVYVSMLSSS